MGPIPTFGYPYEPTRTEGGLEPCISFDENRLAYFDKYSCQFCSIPFLISEPVLGMNFSIFYE